MSDATIDLDAEAILFDGHWYTRDDLARRIKAMLDAGDFNLTRPSAALEQLTATMASIRTVAFRATPEIIDALNRSAAVHGKTVGNRIRDLLIEALNAQPSPAHHVEATPRVAPTVPPVVPPVLPPVLPTSAAAPAVPPVAPLAGPGALRSAGVLDPHPSGPSVVVEPALQEEGAIELTQRKKDEEPPSTESRWFNS